MNLNLKNFRSNRLVAALVLCSCVTLANAGAVVVVGVGSQIGNASKSDVVKVFLGKKKDLAGISTVPIDQGVGTSVRNDFYSNTVRKTKAQLMAYWARLIFTGKGQPPQVVGGDDEIKAMVSAKLNLIGYIDESTVDGSVKVIYKP